MTPHPNGFTPEQLQRKRDQAEQAKQREETDPAPEPAGLVDLPPGARHARPEVSTEEQIADGMRASSVVDHIAGNLTRPGF